MTGGGLFGLPVAWALCASMLVVMYWDLRHMRIPHWLLALIAVVFLLAMFPTLELREVVWRVLAAAVVLALCLVAFAARRLGGGDAKLLPLLILFVPSTDWPLFALCLSVGLITGLIGVRILRHHMALGQSDWTGIAMRDRYPLGPGIGLAGILYAVFGPEIAQLF